MNEHAARGFFVAPDSVRLGEAYGFGPDEWIEVKRELSYGELLDLSETAGAGGVASDAGDGAAFGNGSWHGFVRRYYLMRAALWLVDWSFTDVAGQGVPLADRLSERIEQIASLKPRYGRLVARAIEQYEAEQTEGKDVTPDMLVTAP
jgi:hypothetical protein